MNVSDLTFDIRVDLTDFGPHREGGGIDHAVGENYRIVAEAPNGARWTHFKFFGQTHDCCSIRSACDGYWGSEYEDYAGCAQDKAQEFQSESAARSAAEALLAKIQAAQAAGTLKKLDARYWRETSACYGSEAYEAGGWEAVEARREREEEEYR